MYRKHPPPHPQTHTHTHKKVIIKFNRVPIHPGKPGNFYICFSKPGLFSIKDISNSSGKHSDALVFLKEGKFAKLPDQLAAETMLREKLKQACSHALYWVFIRSQYITYSSLVLDVSSVY